MAVSRLFARLDIDVIFFIYSCTKLRWAQNENFGNIADVDALVGMNVEVAFAWVDRLLPRGCLFALAALLVDLALVTARFARRDDLDDMVY